jgi:translation initiation factor 4G
VCPPPPDSLCSSSSLQVNLNQAENAWKPTVKADTAAVEGEQSEEDQVSVLAKRVRAILNKLCPQKFDTLVQQFRDLPIDTGDKLAKSMELVFEKALDEPVFSVAYARMCQALSMKKIVSDDGKEVNFRQLLITRCQKEFLRDYMEDLDRTAFVVNLGKATTEDERKIITHQFSSQETKLRRRSLGNIRFIGELYRINMLNGRIMHECIQKLLQTTDEESLECMCRLITTVGQLLDKETQTTISSAKPLPGYFSLDRYFQAIRNLIDSKVSTARIRFLMQDLIDLRTARWVARREEAGPKTIEQVHEDAAREILKKSLAGAEQGPPPGRRSEDRGDRRRSQVKAPPKEKQQLGQVIVAVLPTNPHVHSAAAPAHSSAPAPV